MSYKFDSVVIVDRVRSVHRCMGAGDDADVRLTSPPTQRAFARRALSPPSTD